MQVRHHLRNFSNMIRKSDPLIIEKMLNVGTCTKDQLCLEVDLYQNDSDEFDVDPRDCVFLGPKKLTWGFPVPAGTPVDIIFSRDDHGSIKATVVCKDVRVIHILVQ